MLDVAGISRALIEQSPLSTVIYDMTGRPLFANGRSFSRPGWP